MKYSPQEIMQYVMEEDVKFIRLAFCDIYGKQKIYPLCLMNFPGHSNTVLQSMPRPSMVSAMNPIPIYCSIRIHQHWPFCHGVPNTDGLSACSVIFPIRTEKLLNVTPGAF